MLRRVFTFAVVALFAGVASAEPIAIMNADFELPVQEAGGWTNELVGWDAPPVAGDAFIEYIDGFSADGVGHLGIAANGEVSQDLGVGLMPNTTYNLNLSVGNRNASFTPDGSESIFGIYVGGDLADNGTLIAEGVANPFPLGEGVFGPASLTFTTDDNPTAGNMVLSLRSGANGRAHFDAISLEAVPEPSSLLLAVFGMLGLMGIRRR